MHYLYLADDHADWLTLRSASSDRSLPAVDYDRRDLVRGANAAGVVRELAVHHSAGRTEDRVHVGVLSPVTVVPLAEFEESTAEAVYQFVFNGRRVPKAKRRVFYDMLPSSNGVLLLLSTKGIVPKSNVSWAKCTTFRRSAVCCSGWPGASKRRASTVCSYTAAPHKLMWPILKGIAFLLSTPSMCKRPKTYFTSLVGWRNSLVWISPRHRSSFAVAQRRFP